jgi:hypothetical protein
MGLVLIIVLINWAILSYCDFKLAVLIRVDVITVCIAFYSIKCRCRED